MKKQNREVFYVIRKNGTELFLDRENKLDTIQYAHLYDLDTALEEYDLLPYPQKFSVTQVEVCFYNEIKDEPLVSSDGSKIPF